MAVYDDETEKRDDADSATPAEKKEAAALNKENFDGDSSDSPWDTNLSKKDRRRFKFRKKQALIGSGTAGIIIGISLGLSSFLSGPAMILQIANLFQKHFDNVEDLSDTRTGKLIKWANTRNETQRRNMGYLGNKLGDHYEKKLRARGMDPKYDDFRRLRRIEIDTSTPEGKKSLEKMRASGFDPDLPSGSTVATLDLSSESARTRRRAISAMSHALDINGVSTSIASRTLKIRGGVDFHPLKNIARAADEDVRDYFKKRKDERAKKIKNGTRPPPVGEDAPRQDDPNNPGSAEDQAKANEIDAGSEEIQRTAQDPNLTTEQKVSRVKSSLGRGVGATAVLGIVCGLDSLGDNAADLQAANIELPSIRTSMEIISVASQIQSGKDINMDEVGAIYEDLYDEKSKTSVFDAESIQHGLGNEKTGRPIPTAAKPGKERPLFFQAINEFTAVPGISHACSVVNSFVGGIATALVGIAVTATGPAGAVLSVAAEGAQHVLVAATIDDVVKWLAGDALDVSNLAGADYGSVGDSGSFMAANNVCKVSGCTALSNEDRRVLLREQQLQEKEEMKNKSWYARILDPKEPNSLIASTLIKNPELVDSQRTLATLTKAPIQAFSALGKSFGSIIPGVSAATTEPFDYGIDKYGYTLRELDNGDYDNPYQNAEQFENNPGLLEQMNKDFGEVCFGATIDPATGVLKYTQAPSYIKLEENREMCADRSNARLTAYRFYLADKVSLTSMACYEGIDDQACDEIGMTNTTATPATGQAPSPAEAKGKDTSGQNCTIGTDGGIKPTPVESIKIRVCDVEGIVVNVVIEQNVKTIVDGMKAQGLNIGGGGYRSYEGQIAARRSNCGTSQYDIYEKPSNQCSPPTARPGNSMHEWGLAVDFTVNGKTITRGSAAFNWLRANQPQHQLINLPSEAWHWSTTGN